MKVPAKRHPKFGGVRTGGRSARVVDHVLRTTIEVLGEAGYAGLRIDDVAARAGVNKTTVYRRWPTKIQLVAAALRQHYTPIPAPDTGDLQRDLVAMFVESSSAFDALAKRGVMRMIQAERTDPEVESIVGEIRERVTAVRRVRLDAAVRRGELPRRTDVVMLLYMLSAAVHSRLLAYSEPPTLELITAAVDVMIAGARVRWAAVRR